MTGFALLFFLVFFPVIGGPEAVPDVPRAEVETLFQDSYPLEGSISMPAALFHWVDSLAGTSGGKTVPAYRQEFAQRFGKLSAEDAARLQRFQAIRLEEVSRGRRLKSPRRPLNMLGVFLQEPDLAAAFARIEPVLGPEAVDDMAATLEHFRPHYAEIWNGGQVPRRFLDGARQDPAWKDLEGFLARVAHFFGVDPRAIPRPRLVAVPVPPDDGTHAEAVGRNMLVEIRPDDRVKDQAAPIVHENAHYLWQRMSEDLRDRLLEVARGNPQGLQAWELLREALPTAIAQGVADRAFAPQGWSTEVPWYHTEDVDSCAKRIYPLVQEALDTGAPFDEMMMRKLLWAYQGGRRPGAQSAITPR